MTTDGIGHDLAQHGLAGPRFDVELAGQNGQPQQHDAQDGSEQELGTLGPFHPGLLEQGHSVGYGLDPGEGAAPG